jgi:tRNA pseudouridine38-40 synthase
MVRRMVGTLVEVGRGNLPVEIIDQALEDPASTDLKFTAPPSGLYLDQVIYKGESFSPDIAPAMVVGRMQ